MQLKPRSSWFAELDAAGLPLRGPVRSKTGRWLAERALWAEADYRSNLRQVQHEIRRLEHQIQLLLKMPNRLAAECRTRYGASPPVVNRKHIRREQEKLREGLRHAPGEGTGRFSYDGRSAAAGGTRTGGSGDPDPDFEL